MKKNQSRGPWHGQSIRQIMYHKARDMLRRAKLPRVVRAKLFWKDGTHRCRQKNKSDNTTHLPWKTIPMKLHLKKGDDGKGTGFIVLNKEGVQGPMRQRPRFS